MWLLRSSKHYIINNQSRNQISEEDESSLERRRRELLGDSDSEGMPPLPPEKFWNLKAQKCSFNQSNFF